MKAFVMYLEGVQTFWKKEREIVNEICKEMKKMIESGEYVQKPDNVDEVEMWQRDPNALMCRAIWTKEYSKSCRKINEESVIPVYDEAFRFPDKMLDTNLCSSPVVPTMLQEGRNYDMEGFHIFVTGPFGTNNIYVQMDDGLLECLQNLYGHCPPRKERLVDAHSGHSWRDRLQFKSVVGNLLHDEEKLRGWFKANNLEDRFTMIIDEINKSKDMHEGWNERLGCNKFYDIVDEPSSDDLSFGMDGDEDRGVVVFNGLESLLGFLVCLDTNGRKWNDLERSMAYRAACGRAGIPKGKEKEFLPDGSDILATIKGMEK